MNNKLPKIGIVGGIGPESTIYYYQKLIDSFKSTYHEFGYPELIIESLNLKQLVSIVENNNWSELAEMIAQKFNILRSAGAEVGIIAYNTPHKVFNEILSATPLPLISIVTATADYLNENKFQRPLLLGTKYTMQSSFYQDELSPNGIVTVIPEESDRNYIQDKLFNEIELGIIKEETRHEFIKIIKNNLSNNKIDSVILGCTELPLILSESGFDLPYIDTAKIHVDEVVKYCKKQKI